MATKKSFKDDINPAMQFITPQAEEITTDNNLKNPPEGYKLNPLYVETKSKRLQLLIQPSLHNKIKAQAQRENKSINEFIHLILEDAVKGE